MTRRAGVRGDTAIGVLFAGVFALGVFMFSTIQGYVGDLFGFLFGSLLLTGVEDLVALAILATLVLVVVGLLWKELLYATFDPQGAAASGLHVEPLEYLFLGLVALTIVVSLQAVGIILVVAMLVTPAATGQLLTVRFGMLVLLAVVIGIGSSVLGLYVSLLARRRDRGDDRARPDRIVPRGARARSADGAAEPPRTGRAADRAHGRGPGPRLTARRQAPRKSASSATDGMPSRAPARRVEIVAAATARWAAPTMSWPAARPAASAPANVSPAPTASIAPTSRAG